MHKLSERESYSHRKRTKATVGEEINPITTKNKKQNKNQKKVTSSLTFTAGTKRFKSRDFFGSYRVLTAIVTFVRFPWLQRSLSLCQLLVTSLEISKALESNNSLSTAIIISTDFV